MRSLIIKRSHKAKNVMKDHAELLEKPTGDLFKSAKKFTTVSVEIKTNGPLVRAPLFQNKMGRWRRIAKFTKSSITNGKVSVKADDSLVRKYNKKVTFFNRNIPKLKENTTKKKYISR